MQFFPYDLDRQWTPMFLALGVKDTDGVEVTDEGTLRATFGRVSVETPIANIERTVVTGPHKWYKAVGLRLALTDDGVTFGTNPRRGLSIDFAERVPKVIGLRDHSSLWVSVADPEGLAEAINSAKE
ncbi:MAG: hypothetical protein HQ526_00325 [Actinobacteria bacterium]|nr:hypothetical protein [Actinomycetota bacterium]